MAYRIVSVFSPLAVEQFGVFRYGPLCKYLDPSFCPIFPVNGETSSQHGHLARLDVLLSRFSSHFVPKFDVSCEAVSFCYLPSLPFLFLLLPQQLGEQSIRSIPRLKYTVAVFYNISKLSIGIMAFDIISRWIMPFGVYIIGL